jgi:molybdate transport system substrate-binding protein
MASPRHLDAAMPRRVAATNVALIAIFGSLVLVGCLLAFLNGTSDSNSADSEKPTPLIMYCAASNKSVVEAIRQEYQRETGREVQIQYGPSQTLLASAEIAKSGDLYLPADDSYLGIARERQILAEQIDLAQMRAVIAVPQGNPLQITSLADLLRSEIRLAQANPEAAAIGKLTRDHLLKQEQWEPLKAKTAVFKMTVNDVLNDVNIGAVDAGIVFDGVLHDYPKLEAVNLPELNDLRAKVAVGVLKFSKQPTAALHFARYLSARDKGLVRYREHGYEPVAGDKWSDKPELVMYAGSMLQPALEATIKEFEAREGVRVMRVYNGCGILVAQMKSGSVPDAYFACDVEFMKQVRELFPEAQDISQNELVILVKKGNPLQIQSLKDLTKPNLRVGIGHEKQCAMGWLTQRTFIEGGIQTDIMKNVVVQTPTGDMLVNQMRTDSLDAAVAYLSNAAGSAEYLEAIRIRDLPCSVATQPFGVAKNSAQPQLAKRLQQAILADQSKQRFDREGFRWLETGKQP